jgi:hypothetical protein
MSGEQKRDKIGRFKKKGPTLPSFDSPLSAPPKLVEKEEKKQKSILEKFKPKKIVIPEYNPVVEAKKIEEALETPKGWGAKKKQATLRAEVEDKFGDINWDPEARLPREDMTELDTVAISSLNGPTPVEQLKEYSGKTGKAFRFTREADGSPIITKIAENATLMFVDINESLTLPQDNLYRNIEHVILKIGEHEVRLPLTEIIFTPSH